MNMHESMSVYGRMPVSMCVRVCYYVCMGVRMYHCEYVNVCVYCKNIREI